MKLLTFIVLVFLTLPNVAKAQDMLGIGASVANNSQPTYGLDYEIIPKGNWWPAKPYTDIAFYGNSQSNQPYVSFGGQGELINFGIAFADTNVKQNDGSYQAQFSVGPEMGFMKNLTDLVYVKENNAYLDYHGTFFFQATFSLGFNL